VQYLNASQQYFYIIAVLGNNSCSRRTLFILAGAKMMLYKDKDLPCTSEDHALEEDPCRNKADA
jgi:hypothetical protein